MNRFARDLIERALATFGEAFCAALLLSLAGAPALPSLSLVEKAAGAGVIAVLALLKGLAASFLGNKDSAALLPTGVDVPATPQLVVLPAVTGEVAAVTKAATAKRKPIKKTPSRAKVSKGTIDPAP